VADTIESSVSIARPVREVFDHVANPTTWPAWSTTVTSVKAPPGGLEPGAEFTVVAKLLGRRFTTHASVTEFEVGHLLSYASTSGPVPSTFTWRFEEVPDGTRVVQSVIGDEDRIGRFFRLAFPLVERIFRRQMAADLATLKDLLERGR
jgi:uncharacterized membrane protein